MCDAIAIWMQVEDKFGMTISEQRAARINTVGDLFLCVLGQQLRGADSTCPTSRSFYQLRRKLNAEFGIDREQIRPVTSLAALFPARARCAIWPRLAEVLGLHDLPELPQPKAPSLRAFRNTLLAVAAAWWMAFFALTLTVDEDFTIAYGCVITFLLALLVSEFFGLFWLAGMLDYRERVRVPQVRHLVIRMVLNDAEVGPTPRLVWKELAEIVAAETGLSAEEIRPEQTFAELPDYC